MQRWFLTGCAGFFLTVIVSTGRGDNDNSFDLASPVPQLITHLSDPDPAIRLDAVQRLINLGDTARPALRLALPTADTQTRSEIDRVLLHIRWTGFGDDQMVEHAFAGYAEKDAEGRCDQIDSWLALQTGGQTALLRILIADPSPAVRWEAAAALAGSMQEGDMTARQITEYAAGKNVPHDAYLPPPQNAPLLAAAGWAVHLSNPARATDLISKAVTIEGEHPSAFRGQMDFACQWLSARAAQQKDYPQMIRLLRQEAERSPWNPNTVPDAVAQLFALHADFGPLPGLGDDLRCYHDYLVHPEMVYTLGRMMEKRDHPLAASAFNTVALLMGGTSTDAHYQTGTFLVQRGWTAAAERELRCSLALSGGKLYYAYFELSALADLRDDDLGAAQDLERGLEEMRDTGQMRQTEIADQFQSQIEWHYVRAYRDTHNRAALQTHLDKFLLMDQNALLLQRDPGMAADIVPALQELDRNEQADRIFDAAYQALSDKITTDPTDPMPKNNLAWLCACSGKKLDEAVKYADQAVALDPEDAACMDTQAEAYFRTGNAHKAIEIETHALQIKSEDVYMKKQLDRFRAAVK